MNKGLNSDTSFSISLFVTKQIGILMKVLLIDRDDVAVGLLEGYFANSDYELVVEPDRNKVFNHGDLNEYQAILMDLSAQTNPIKYIIDLKAQLKTLPFIILMSKEGREKDVFKAGANAFLKKPIDKLELNEYLEQAQMFHHISKTLSDTEIKFPYHRGIISNSAMNELFLSCLDRTSRYIEDSFFLIFSLKNAKQLYEDYGADLEEQASQWMSNNVIRLRRQSDIMAQIGKSEFAILIQRPVYKDEPIDAAKRFRASFLQHPGADIPQFEGAHVNVNVNIKVVELPGARKHFDETIMRP